MTHAPVYLHHVDPPDERAIKALAATVRRWNGRLTAPLLVLSDGDAVAPDDSAVVRIEWHADLGFMPGTTDPILGMAPRASDSAPVLKLSRVVVDDGYWKPLLRAVLLHELGHVLGLTHLDTDSTPTEGWSTHEPWGYVMSTKGLKTPEEALPSLTPGLRQLAKSRREAGVVGVPA